MTGASAIATVNPFNQAHPMADASDSGTASTQSATISANDFLTLLVTEMKNQDPTAQTDPNEYINQLVQVNSLEQLIQINQNLSTALGTTSGSAASESSGRKTDAVHPPDGMTRSPASMSQGQYGDTNGTTAGIGGVHYRQSVGSGNLSIPTPIPAAQRVAQSLSGRR